MSKFRQSVVASSHKFAPTHREEVFKRNSTAVEGSKK